MGIARRSNSKNHRRLREEAAASGGLLKYTEGSSVDYRVWLRIQDGMEPPARAVAFLARKGYLRLSTTYQSEIPDRTGLT